MAAMQKQRVLLSISAAAMMVVGCSAEPGTAPAGQTSMQAPASMNDEEAGSIRLSGDGIRTTGPDGAELPFSSSRDDVERAVTAALGAPQSRERNDECGAGSIETSVYLGGVTLNFQQDFLVGWYVNSPSDPARATTPEGIRAGSPIADARKVYTITPIRESTLGQELATDEGIGIFLAGESDDSDIESLYAGTNCFFR